MPGSDFFNDLSQAQSRNTHSEARRESHESPSENNEQVLKPKRIACVLCRKRKLKCDTVRPSCGTCARLGHGCFYDEVRKKSGPKRGYVKALEARLAQVETLLKTQEDPSVARNLHGGADVDGCDGQDNAMLDGGDSDAAATLPSQVPLVHSEVHIPAGHPFPWEMIGLGLDEALPPQTVVNELDQIYFEKVHPSVPMIHRARYHAAMNLAPHVRPPACLRYAMWTNAAAVSDKHESLAEQFYQRARKYVQQDEMRGHGENMITIAHCQTWVLLAIYEIKLMYFPRAWMSTGRACRMTQMMGLHRLDGTGLDVKQCLPPPKDWTEREERRRTLWMSFCMDRYSSIGTGWPMVLDEIDIKTSLPGEEDAYDFSRPARTMSLCDALGPSGTWQVSSFAGVILTACLLGRNLTHLHRPTLDDKDDDLNGEFWERHVAIDNLLLNAALAMPDQLKLPAGLNTPNAIHMNFNIHTSIICLHQAAIFKADRNRLPPRVAADSKVRCITAATEIASIMRQISHMDLSMLSPFITFSLSVAARVFVQHLKSRPQDGQVRLSLQFLLSAMRAIKRKNPFTESFLVQLDVDLQSIGAEESSETWASKQRNRNGLSNCAPRHVGADATSCGKNNDNPSYSVTPGNSQLELTSRQRMPGIVSSAGMQQTANVVFPHEMDGVLPHEMETSPYASGGQQTPGSTNQSHPTPDSHAPPYSPLIKNSLQDHQQPNCLQMEPNHLSAMLDPGDPAFATGFDVNAFPTSSNVHGEKTGFTLQQQWPGGGTGPTPGPSMSPAGMNELVNRMSDADWSNMMESFAANGWDGALGQQDAGNPPTMPPGLGGTS